MKNLRSFFQKIKTWILVIAGVVILIQIMFFTVLRDLTFLITTALLTMGVYLNKLNERILVKIGLVLIAFCPLLLILEKVFTAEKVAIWAFVFLSLGLIKKVYSFFETK